jgi:hypothetical protein
MDGGSGLQTRGTLTWGTGAAGYRRGMEGKTSLSLVTVGDSVMGFGMEKGLLLTLTGPGVRVFGPGGVSCLGLR